MTIRASGQNHGLLEWLGTLVILRARWLSRVLNQEADDRTNMELRVDPKKRSEVDIAKLGLDVTHVFVQGRG